MADQLASNADRADQESRPIEESLGDLERIVRQLEATEMPLEKSIELFEQGMKLSETCRKQLLEAETRVEALIRRGDRLEPVPFEPEPE